MGIFSFFKKNKEVSKEIKSNFNVIISPTALTDVVHLLKKQNKTAIRFVATGFCWSGSKFDVVLDEQKENDLIVEQNGVKFVVNSNYKNVIGTVEVIRLDNKITTKNH